MKPEDYPALYRSADSAAARAQATHLSIVRGYSYLVMAAAGLGLYGVKDQHAAVWAALLLIASTAMTVWIAVSNYEDTWYRARAVAESIKTSAWRFMMRGDPYTDSDPLEVVKTRLRTLLKDVLREHNSLSHVLGGATSMEEQITHFMCDVRNSSLDDRIKFYRKYRIDEQRSWYADKSRYNIAQSRIWIGLLIGSQAIAIVLSVLRILKPEYGFWPTEIFIVAAGCALTWTQAKRFRQLASAYALTAHEIGIIRGELDDVKDENQFAQFVMDGENAFSREHTQWLARKDVS